MTLARGSKLGAYEIVAPLGAGGMGEVYRARDTKLDRDVAVKVLPAHLGENPERIGHRTAPISPWSGAWTAGSGWSSQGRPHRVRGPSEGVR